MWSPDGSDWGGGSEGSEVWFCGAQLFEVFEKPGIQATNIPSTKEGYLGVAGEALTAKKNYFTTIKSMHQSLTTSTKRKGNVN